MTKGKMTNGRLKSLFQRVFSTEEGALALGYLAEYAYADKAEFCEDPRKDAYIQGRRSVVLEIRKILSEEFGDE